MKTRTKVALVAPVVAGLVGGLGLGTLIYATPAHADPMDGTIAAINAAAQFSVDVTNAGFYNPDPKAQLLLGITACNNLDAGWTGVQDVQWVYRNTNSTVGVAAARQFFDIAVRDLCPWHYGQAMTVSAPYGPGSDASTV